MEHALVPIKGNLNTTASNGILYNTVLTTLSRQFGKDPQSDFVFMVGNLLLREGYSVLL